MSVNAPGIVLQAWSDNANTGTQTHQMTAYMLVQALDEDQEGDIVEYGKIFEEDREYNQGEFAECLRDQWLQVGRGADTDTEASALASCSTQLSTGAIACLGTGVHPQCLGEGRRAPTRLGVQMSSFTTGTCMCGVWLVQRLPQDATQP